MNYLGKSDLHILYDSLPEWTAGEMPLDTTQAPDYTNRIEYQQLQTQKRLLTTDLLYNKWSFLPTLSANAAFNLNFQNNHFWRVVWSGLSQFLSRTDPGATLLYRWKKENQYHHCGNAIPQ